VLVGLTAAAAFGVAFYDAVSVSSIESPDTTMRFQRLVFLSVALVACHRPTEVRGLYLSAADSGWFFPCDDAKTVVSVQDAALFARYQHIATSSKPVFVRLRGIKGHEGSIYGGRRYFSVQQILEVRPRASGECPAVAQPVGPLLPVTTTR
jgi:hypothetical protein